MSSDLQVVSTPDQLAERCAVHIVQVALLAFANRGVFRLCVAGGNTPRGAYARLAQQDLAHQLDWQRVHIYFGDERCVPPDHPQSNYHMLHESLLSRVPIPPSRVHRIAGEAPPPLAAQSYSELLRSALGVEPDGSPRQTFDLVLLGLGADGHTASLFPGSSLELEEWVSPRQHPTTGEWRVTLTEPLLNSAEETLFLVAGEDKAERLAEVRNTALDMLRLPAQRIVPRGHLRFLVDQAAASRSFI
ncbi:MAG: 6-phosphogluconolactonase [Polyangiales bacterium]